jgi:hypothetical protein
MKGAPVNAPQPVQQNKEKKKDAARASEETAFDSAAPIQLPVNLASPLTYRNNLLQLQRLIGNQATIRLLKTTSPRIQRELTAEQLRDGVQYYQMLSEETLRRVRVALNLAGSGGADEALVRAAAEWQLTNAPEQVNGILTRPQITQLTAFGLETPESRAAYVDYTESHVEGRWETLTTPQQRMEAIMGGINTRLGAIGVPGCGFALSDDLGRAEGAEFDALNWRINFKRSELERGDIEYLMSAAYHEARHAEQTFLAMRYLLGNSPMTEFFRTLFNSIHQGALERARAANAGGALTPLQQQLASEWCRETFENADITNEVYARWQRAANALATARESGDARAIAEAEAEYRAAVNAYVRLSGETDAYRVGGAVVQDYRRARALEDASAPPETAPTTG